MELNEYIKPELLVLIPVLYLIGVAVKKSKIADKFIPWILGGVSVALSALWIFLLPLQVLRLQFSQQLRRAC